MGEPKEGIYSGVNSESPTAQKALLGPHLASKWMISPTRSLFNLWFHGVFGVKATCKWGHMDPGSSTAPDLGLLSPASQMDIIPS